MTPEPVEQENAVNASLTKKKYLLFPVEKLLKSNRRTGCGPSGDQDV